jgi:hypothetical protein
VIDLRRVHAVLADLHDLETFAAWLAQAQA